MLTLRKITSLARTIQRPVSFGFAGDKWKDRDQAAEKVFVSQQERQTLKKLLKKAEQDKFEEETNMEQFDRRLSEIMRRYRIENDTLSSEIKALHKRLM